MGGLGSGRRPLDVTTLPPSAAVRVLINRGYTLQEVSDETGLSIDDVRSLLSIMTNGYDRPATRRDRREIIERALVTGLATGGTVTQIAAILGESRTNTDKYLHRLREQHGAKTNEHLIALLVRQLPCQRCAAPTAPPPSPVAATPAPVPVGSGYAGSLCPDCGGLIRYTEGCEKCLQCGYTKC